MSFLLPKLTCKREVDQAIKSVAEKVLVLRFGRDNDAVCLQLDDIVRPFLFFLFFFNGLYKYIWHIEENVFAKIGPHGKLVTNIE